MNNPRTIETHYYNRKELVKTTRAVYANSAVLHCVNHMQMNHYGATVAEVFDGGTGTLHAVVTRSKADRIEIIFKREVEGAYE